MNYKNALLRHEPLRIAIIGLGSRGLSILERFLSLSAQTSDRLIQIAIFEPNEPGAGIHDPYQPDYLLLNTIACQLSMFPDEAAIGSLDERRGPNFYIWCTERDIRIGDDGLPCQTGGRPIAPTDFLPRRLIGEYLSWAYQNITADIPANVEINIYQEKATRIVPSVDGRKYVVCADSGINEEVDRLFVTIGHAGRRHADTGSEAKRVIIDTYPLPCTVERIAAGMFVGVEGFGLAAMDTIAALTVGRGGRFRRTNNDFMTYVASGNEPRIMLYSRSGLPFRVRPETTVGREKHQALFLTPNMIAEIRRGRPDGKIDFETDVLPLIECEMRAAFYLTCVDILKSRARDANCIALRCEMIEAFAAGRLDELFTRLSAKYGMFSPNQHLLISIPEGLEEGAYADWVRKFVEEDLKEGTKGLLSSPLKAALEVWRDIRDAIRTVVDHGGLTSESHRTFFTTYARLANRTVAGPQKERHQELLTLIDAGIVIIAPGINPHVVWKMEVEKFELMFDENPKCTFDLDWIVCARVVDSRISDTNSPVLADLSRAGLVIPIYPISGMDGVKIDVNSHPINVLGDAIENIWILGPVVEGSTYYNHYIPSDGAYSRALSDAHRAVCACLGSGNFIENELRVVA